MLFSLLFVGALSASLPRCVCIRVCVCVLVCWCASAILFDCFCACACAKAARVFVLVTFAGYANILRGTLPKDMDSFASFAICLTIASAPGPATTDSAYVPCAPLRSLLLLLKNFSCSLLYCLVVFSIACLLLAWLFIYLLFVICKIYFWPSSSKNVPSGNCEI